MPQLSIADLDETTLELLGRRAAQHGRSLEAEARIILAKALASADSWAATNALRQELVRAGREFPDSTPLLREDRDR